MPARVGDDEDDRPLDLAGAPLRELVDRNGSDCLEYDEMILGCIDQLGPDAMEIARNAWLAAGVSGQVPGPTAAKATPSSAPPR